MSRGLQASVFYRIASVLLLLFAAGHTIGFLQVDPKWGVDSMILAMRTIRFDVQGSTRTYWDFYLGFGFFVSVLLVFSAVLAWQLGGTAATTLKAMRGIVWSLAGCFGALAILSLTYFF